MKTKSLEQILAEHKENLKRSQVSSPGELDVAKCAPMDPLLTARIQACCQRRIKNDTCSLRSLILREQALQSAGYAVPEASGSVVPATEMISTRMAQIKACDALSLRNPPA